MKRKSHTTAVAMAVILLPLVAGCHSGAPPTDIGAAPVAQVSPQQPVLGRTTGIMQSSIRHARTHR